MELGQNNYLPIGEFARLSGIKRVNLIYYDEIGLFSPEIVKENGYRYYSYRQLDTVNVIYSLKEIGVPLKEIKTYLDERTPDKMIQLFTEKKKQIDREIQKLQSISSMMQARIELTEQGKRTNIDRIYLVNCGKEYILRGDPIIQEESQEENIIRFYDYCTANDSNFGYPIGAILPGKNLTAGEFHALSYYFIKSEKGDYPLSNAVKPAGSYAIGYMNGDYLKTDRLYDRLLLFIKEKNLEICGDAYEEIVLDEVSLGDPEQYLSQISIQVCVN